MEENRIDKEHYKEAVTAEKSKLLKQIIVMTVLAAVISFSFMGILLSNV